MPWQPSTDPASCDDLGRPGRLCGRRAGSGARRARSRSPECPGIWSCACLLYLAHVASAFHFWHGWSHAAAYAHTATQVAAVVGLNWGGGIYANYAFTALWLVEVAWWWAAPVSYEMRPKGGCLHRSSHLPVHDRQRGRRVCGGPMRWVGVGLVAALLVAWLRSPRPQPAQR